MLGREKCIACGRVSPETNGDNTLTTSFGWRVIRVVDDRGGAVVEWRCAACWQRHKAAQANSSEHPSGNGPSSPPRDPRNGDR
jgi:hypothetical protein